MSSPALPDPSGAAAVPRATYRLQFNRDFTFDAARGVVPYLARLGVSHVYASPIFKARPGSSHGYDVTDHTQLNPELGTRADFDRFVDALHRHRMGLILDLVPNHLGVMGEGNVWWLDVLENGPAARYASHFDIDWVFTCYVSLANYHRAVILIHTRVMSSGCTIDAIVHQATDTSGTSAKHLTNSKAITQLTQAGSDSYKDVAIEVRTDELDVAGGFDCIALGYTVGTAASLLSIEIYGLVPRFAEVSTTAWDQIVD